MGVKLQFVLGLILLCSVWISSGTSIEINTSQPQEHQNDDKTTNGIEKQPKTESENKYVNNNTPTTTHSETRNKISDTEPIIHNYEKQNELEKDTSSSDDNAIKKDTTAPKRREGTGRSIDIEKYISPEFQNNEFTLPVSSDTEKYLDEPFSFKTSTRLGSEFDHTTSKTSMFSKFTEPIQKLEQEFEDRLKHSDHDHHDFGDDHDDEHDQENDDHERDFDHENEDDMDDMTVDKMIERSESVPTNISMGWEMKVSKDDTDKNNNNLKSFTVVKYRKVDYVKHFNDTKVFLNDPKGDSQNLNTTTSKPVTTTTRKSNLLTKPPAEQNNSHLLSNKIETETIKAINLVTTEVPSTKRTKGDEGFLPKEQISQESQLTIAVTPPADHVRHLSEIGTDENTTIAVTLKSDHLRRFSETAIDENTTNEIEKNGEDLEETTIRQNKAEQTTTLNSSSTRKEIPLAKAEPTTNINKKTAILKNIRPYQTTTVKISSDQQTTSETTIDTERTTVNLIKPYRTTTTVKVLPSHQTTPKITAEMTTNSNRQRTRVKIAKPIQTVEILPSQRTIPNKTEKMPVVSSSTNESTPNSMIPETTISEDLPYPNTTEFPKEDIYLGTDVTTTIDEEITTEFEAPKTSQVRSFQSKTTAFEVTNTKMAEAPRTSTPSIVTYNTSSGTLSPGIVIDVNSSGDILSTTSNDISDSTIEISTIDSTQLLNKIKAETTTEAEELTTTKIPIEVTAKTADTTENLAYTGHVSEIMSDGTTIMPEVSTEKDIPSTKSLEIKPYSKSKMTPPVTTTTTTSKPASEIVTTEVNFVHVETVGTNQTTFIPETLSPNFNYPIESIDKRERAIPNVIGNASTVSTVETTTTTDDSEETTNTSSATENIITDDGGSNKGKIAAIVISTVGAICLVILAGLLYIMKKRQRKFNYKQRCRPVSLDDYSVDNISAYNSVRRKGIDRQSKRSYGNPAFEDSSLPSHPLNFPALAKFATIVEDMKAEFEEIPQISARASELPEGCEIKNRYANVIPLPETRVYLKTVEGLPNSDYINANYVTGPKNTRGYYIACQAPKQNTVDDFWRMVWEQQSRVILMITHLFENGIEKCADYLPPSEVLDCHRLFGDFQVTLKKREAKEKYIISSIQLKNMVSNSWRDVTHFWYLGWPEKGVPSEANSLIAFLIEARSYMKASTLDKNSSPNDMRNDPSQNELNPVVVHCSPGTGRTGVVIACDIAIREFEKIRLVDIPKIVYKIRRDRANAVQTKEQYMFIYKVISLYATKLTGGALDSF